MTKLHRRILRLPDVKTKTGLGHDAIYKLAREGKFPKQVKITDRASGWFEDEIEAWLESRAALRTPTSIVHAAS